MTLGQEVCYDSLHSESESALGLPTDSMVTLGEPGDGQVSRDVNFTCRIHPEAQSDVGEPKWVFGFYNKLSLCVKCCRIVDSLPSWRLSPFKPIQSDHLLIADYNDTAFWAGILRWQDPVHSWKASPGSVCKFKSQPYQCHLKVVLIRHLMEVPLDGANRVDS